MADVSTFRTTLIFFDRLGVYDVILPFLLVFTIVYAILDKTMVLGSEMFEDRKVPRKNLNAMVGFVIAFLTVASSRLVATINEIAAHVVLLLFLSVMFLMLVGSFWKETGQPMFLDKPWSTIFMVIMFVGIIVIFLNAITYNGVSWLWIIFAWLGQFNNSDAVSSIVLIIVVLLFMWFIVKEPSKKPDSK